MRKNMIIHQTNRTTPGTFPSQLLDDKSRRSTTSIADTGCTVFTGFQTVDK
jgi:hypothetical protein